jgi:CelD/BcsL family acetyltransferase involved in cellulose biosynthesis
MVRHQTACMLAIRMPRKSAPAFGCTARPSKWHAQPTQRSRKITAVTVDRPGEPTVQSAATDHLALREYADIKHIQAIVPEWEALLASVPGALPFQTPAWCFAWFKAFGVRSLWRRDTLQLIAFFAQNRLVALVPVVRTSLGLSDNIGVALYRPIGSDPNLTEVRTPLIAPGFETAVANRLLHHARMRNGVHKIMLPEALLTDAMSSWRGWQPLDTRTVVMYRLALGADWTTFKTGLKRNIKESLRHCYNSLAKESLSPRLEVVNDTHAIAQRLDAFYALHGKRAALTTTVSHPDYFAKALHREFLAGVLAHCKTTPGLQPCLFCLWVDDQCVAMRMGFKTNQELYLYYTGYEPEWGRYSVMTTLVAEMLQWAIQQGLPSANLSVGTDVSKTRWSPSAQTFTETFVVGGNGLGAKLSARLASWYLARRKATAPHAGQ